MVTVWEYSPGDVFLSMLWFFLFFIWIWLLISVFSDIFRSHDMGGVAKAIWVIFVIFLPFLGVFVYLIARGDKMTEHAIASQQQQQQQFDAYVKQTASSASVADQLTQLAALRDAGTISPADYEAGKAKILA